jgi:hypothetical protein
MADTMFPSMDKDFAPRPSSPIASPADPITSHLAAGELVESGARETNCQKVFDALVKYGPEITRAELAFMSGLDPSECARRLPDLAARGKAIRGPARECNVSLKHQMAITWSAIK